MMSTELFLPQTRTPDIRWCLHLSADIGCTDLERCVFFFLLSHVVVVFFTLSDRASTITYPVIYVVVNPVRSLLGRKRSEEHLQMSNESMKQNKKKGTVT